MDRTLRPFAKRLGVNTEAGLRLFVEKANDAIRQVDIQIRDADIERRKNVARSSVFTSVQEFAKIVGWPDCEQVFEIEDLAIIIQSSPHSKFYGDCAKSLEATKSLCNNQYRKVGSFFEDAAQKSFFRCSICHEFSPLCCVGYNHTMPWLFENHRCTIRRDTHWTRDSYGDEWHKYCSFGWLTPLCKRCLRNVCDDFGNHDTEKEFAYLSKTIKSTARNISKQKP